MGPQPKLPLCSHSFGECAARSAVQKRLPRLDLVNEISADTVERLNELSVFEANSLMHVYVKRGSLVNARHVFDHMPMRDVVSWNTLILGYAKHDDGARALELYAWMWREGVQPSNRSFVGGLKACSNLEAKQVEGKCVKTGCLEKGRAIHSHVLKTGFELDTFVATTLVDMYAKSGVMEDAQRTFDELPHRDVVTWTTMIVGYAKQEGGAQALESYARMHLEDVQPNDLTFVGVLKACSSLAALEEVKQVDGKHIKNGCLEKGRAIHSKVVTSGFESDAYVATTLVDVYVKCGSLEDARCVFDELAYRDEVSWNAMILGYAEHEQSEEAFSLYAQMQEQGLSPDSFTFIAILKACGSTPALETAKEIHSHINRFGIATSAIVVTSLIDIYAKCGSMVHAQQLFEDFPTKDVVRWNALMAGYARQGKNELVFALFERMRQEHVQPDDVTFVCVLNACSHVGMVDVGQKYFQAMVKQYDIVPTIEHYTCMVDLLGRAGQVNEALVMVEKMPFQPNAVLWATVLGACRKSKNVEVGRRAFDNVVRLDEKLPSAYVLMANIYADAHMQEDCERILGMRKEAQAWEKPEQGNLSYLGEISEFVCGGW